jgi:hypothetical protein
MPVGENRVNLHGSRGWFPITVEEAGVEETSPGAAFHTQLVMTG